MRLLSKTETYPWPETLEALRERLTSKQLVFWTNDYRVGDQTEESFLLKPHADSILFVNSFLPVLRISKSISCEGQISVSYLLLKSVKRMLRIIQFFMVILFGIIIAGAFQNEIQVLVLLLYVCGCVIVQIILYFTFILTQKAMDKKFIAYLESFTASQ